jgi:heme exporter protein B
MKFSNLQAFMVLMNKDVVIELRSKESMATLTLFAAVLAFVFAFGFMGDPQVNLQVVPGILWASLLFTGALGVGRTFAREQEQDVFTALILSPVPRAMILASKVCINLLLSLGTMLFMTPLIAILLHVDLSPYWQELSILIFLSALGFTLTATPLAVMAINARFPEVLLPMVVFPLVSPVMICGVRGCAALLGTSVDQDYWAWAQMMLAFDLMIGLGSFFLFDWMVNE